ncbi:MAG TPA: hypothetical protein VFQ61_00700 [Polyangiaceae bacterium]|nr:hypothetical protein [Polyangiaceae bacterium]
MKPVVCWLRRVSSLAALVLGAGCSSPTESTGVGNPSLTLALVTDERAEPTLVGAGGGSGTDVEVDAGEDEGLQSSAVHQAILVFGGLRLLPCDPALPPTVVPGRFVVDLKRQTTEPELPAIPGVSGGYCEIDVPLVRATAPAEIAGTSIYFAGERSDGTEFILYADVRAVLRLRATPGGAWDPERTPHLLWAFRPRRWLLRQELESAAATLDEDGARVIVIDIDRHPLLFRAIKARIAGRSSLHLDRDNDGVLDEDERDSSALLGQGLEDTE